MKSASPLESLSFYNDMGQPQSPRVRLSVLCRLPECMSCRGSSERQDLKWDPSSLCGNPPILHLIFTVPQTVPLIHHLGDSLPWGSVEPRKPTVLQGWQGRTELRGTPHFPLGTEEASIGKRDGRPVQMPPQIHQHQYSQALVSSRNKARQWLSH